MGYTFNPFTGTLDWTADTTTPPAPQDALLQTVVAGQVLSGHRAVTPRDDGKVIYADPATIGNQPVWITTGAAIIDDPVTVVTLGEISEGSWSWDPGNIYLGANGVITQTEPTSGALVIVGSATSDMSMFVYRQQTIDL